MRGPAQVKQFGDEVREARLRWFEKGANGGIYCTKDVDYVAARQEEKTKISWIETCRGLV